VSTYPWVLYNMIKKFGLLAESALAWGPPQSSKDVEDDTTFMTILTTGITGLWLPSVHSDVAF